MQKEEDCSDHENIRESGDRESVHAAMNKEQNANIWKERAFQVFLVLVGAAIALCSAKLTQTWETSKRKDIIADYLKGVITFELNLRSKLKTKVGDILKERPDARIDSTSFEWHPDLSLLDLASSCCGNAFM